MGSTHNNNICLSALGIGLLLTTPAQAATEEDLFLQLSGDEEIISIATGTPKAISKAPAVATVITADDIKTNGAKTVHEVLENVPGLHLGYSTVNRMRPIFSIRGIHTSNNPHTLILVNGHGIPDLFAGGIQTNLYMPVENIARIEIIRGPGSAVYGADAFAGVINIITKTDADIKGARAGLRGGSFGTRHIWGQYGGTHKGWHVAASVEHNQSDGDRGRIIDSDLQTIFDGLFATSASLAPGPLDTRFESLHSNLTLLNGNWGMQFHSWNQRDTGLGPGVAQALDPTGHNNHDQYLFNIDYTNKHWRPNWDLKANLSYYYSKLEGRFTIFPPGAVLPIGTDGNAFTSPLGGIVAFPDGYIGNPDSTSEVTQFNLTTLYNGMSKHLWRFNFGMKYETEHDASTQNFGPGVIDGTVSPIDGTLTDVTDTPSIFHPGANRTVTYLSVQDEWDFAPDWQLIAGVRYDHYSDFGNTINPRLSLIWNTQHNLTTKLLYGRAFRAPSFAELYAQNNPVTLGNPDLDPETIDTLELAFDYKPTDALHLNASLFHYHINGLIDFSLATPAGLLAENARDQKASGLELEAQWQFNKQLRLFGSFAMHNAEDADSGSKVADAPRKQLHLGGLWRFAPKWSAQLDAFRIMDRPRAAGDVRPEVDDYTWVNLTVNVKKYLKGVDLQLAVRNLTDTDAREPGPTSIPNDYPLEGRSIMLGISMDLN